MNIGKRIIPYRQETVSARPKATPEKTEEVSSNIKSARQTQASPSESYSDIQNSTLLISRKINISERSFTVSATNAINTPETAYQKLSDFKMPANGLSSTDVENLKRWFNESKEIFAQEYSNKTTQAIFLSCFESVFNDGIDSISSLKALFEKENNPVKTFKSLIDEKLVTIKPGSIKDTSSTAKPGGVIPSDSSSSVHSSSGSGGASSSGGTSGASIGAKVENQLIQTVDFYQAQYGDIFKSNEEYRAIFNTTLNSVLQSLNGKTSCELAEVSKTFEDKLFAAVSDSINKSTPVTRSGGSDIVGMKVNSGTNTTYTGKNGYTVTLYDNTTTIKKDDGNGGIKEYTATPATNPWGIPDKQTDKYGSSVDNRISGLIEIKGADGESHFINILCHPNVSNNEMKKLAEIISNYPAEGLKDLYTDANKIVLAKELSTQKQGYKISYHGYYQTVKNEIAIAVPYLTEGALVHEVGHAIDTDANSKSGAFAALNKNFHQLCLDTEAPGDQRPYAMSDVREFFAEYYTYKMTGQSGMPGGKELFESLKKSKKPYVQELLAGMDKLITDIRNKSVSDRNQDYNNYSRIPKDSSSVSKPGGVIPSDSTSSVHGTTGAGGGGGVSGGGAINPGDVNGLGTSTTPTPGNPSTNTGSNNNSGGSTQNGKPDIGTTNPNPSGGSSTGNTSTAPSLPNMGSTGKVSGTIENTNNKPHLSSTGGDNTNLTSGRDKISIAESDRITQQVISSLFEKYGKDCAITLTVNEYGDVAYTVNMLPNGQTGSKIAITTPQSSTIAKPTSTGNRNIDPYDYIENGRFNTQRFIIDAKMNGWTCNTYTDTNSITNTMNALNTAQSTGNWDAFWNNASSYGSSAGGSTTSKPGGTTNKPGNSNNGIDYGYGPGLVPPGVTISNKPNWNLGGGGNWGGSGGGSGHTSGQNIFDVNANR